MTIIELPDEYASALRAKAAAHGLSLEAWFKLLAEKQDDLVEPLSLRNAADIILGNVRDLPREVIEVMPQDGASQHDHYIYGWPKKEA